MKCKKLIFAALYSVFLLVLVVAAVKVYAALQEYRQVDTVYKELQDTYVVPDTDTAESSLQSEKPIVSGSGIVVDFEKLKSANADVIGWLYCPDTPINYPVVQGEDNEVYLHAGLDGNYLRSGTLFADCRNNGLGEDRQFIIYGHSMRNKTMFGSLMGYKKQAYYDEHPVLYYLTSDGEFRIELFAGCVRKIAAISYRPNPDAADFSSYLQEIRNDSTFDSDVTVTPDDVVVVFSTCSYEFDGARYVVFGKLIEVTE